MSSHQARDHLRGIRPALAAGCLALAFAAIQLSQACFGISDALVPASETFVGGTAGAFNRPQIQSLVTRNLLMPKNIKWKKPHTPAVKPFKANDWKYKGEAYKGNKPHFGKYALQIREEAWIRAYNIEACRRMMVRTLRKRGGKHWIRVFPHQACTKRSADSRMGAGKGSIDSWVAAVRPGFILFEIDGTDEFTARGAMGKIQRYLPFKTKFLIMDKPSRFEMGLAGSLVKKTKHIPLEFRKDT